MIYKFKSKAAGDVIMLGPNGDQMLRLIGREPAPQGIIEVGQMAAAIDALRAAVQAEDDRDAAAADSDNGQGHKGVSLRQRVWPVIELLKRSLDARQPVVWGV